MLRNMGSKDALAGPPSSAGEKSVAEVFRSDEQPPPTPARLHKRKSWTASSREVWEYREVLYFLVLRNLKVRYRQTVLGAAWSVLQPLAFMGLFVLIVEKLMTVRSEGAPYPLFAFAALVPFGLFSQSLTLAAPSVVQDINLVSKVYVPRLLIPLAAVGALVVDFLISLAILFAMMAIYSTSPDLSALVWIPSLTVLALVTSVAVGVWLSALMVMYRDVRAIVPFLAQVFLFLTPVAYPTSLVPDRWLIIYGLNPMASVVEGFRSALLGSEPPPARMLAASVIAAIALLGAALSYFHRVDRVFADVI
ncbi:MAG: ABC transporter permease [Actinobacteria bacterium]|nr:MAG: ABC transporter permease [Actinomycetota bacterium]